MDYRSLTAIPRTHEPAHILEVGTPISPASLAASGLYVHSLPGRLRVESPPLKGDCVLAARIERRLRSIPGVKRVELHTSTARILVEYSPTIITPNRLIAEMDRLQCFIQIASGPEFFHSGPTPRPSNGDDFKSITEKVSKMAVAAVLSGLL